MVTKLWFLIFSFILISIEGVTLPSVDLDSLGGQLGFIGDFIGISPVKEYSQFESSQTNSLIISNIQDNTIIYKFFANINGTVNSYCQISDSQYILAGNFNTINGTGYNHIAQLDTNTQQLSPLQQGLDGPVKSLYCFNQSVYVGGDFMAPIITNTSDFFGHIALWQNNQWLPVPWKGFNGPVNTIIQHPQQQSILFGGQFDSTGDGKFNTLNTSQSVNLASSASISGGNSALSGNNTDPASVICSKSPWLLQGGVPGYWEAQFGSSVSPLVFRISNTHLTEQSTNEFNIIALGSNQYFGLSYKDPVLNQMTTCSEKCILSNDPAIPYQDFTVTNNMTASGIRINIESWFGTGGGLGGVEIFSSDVSLQPHITKNTNENSGCSSSGPSSSVTTTGNWTEVYSYQTYQNFLIASFPSDQLQTTTDISVTYSPYIPTQDIYNVYVTTPGCVGTSTCNQRTQVQLSVSLQPGNTSTLIIDQRNTADNISLIYSGPVYPTTTSFQPSIKLSIAPNPDAPSSTTISIVANSIQFIKNTTGNTLSSILNYYPSNNTWLPLTQQLPSTSTVNTLQANENQIYIGGHFGVNNTFNNIVAFDFATGLLPLRDSGLNGNVTSALLVGSQLVVGGNFTNTAQQNVQGLNNIAIYDTQANTWSSMNGGVNGAVSDIYTTDDTHVQVSGSFSSVNGSPAYNNAQWSLKDRAWAPSSSLIIGPVSNQFSAKDTTFYLGSIKSAQSYRANHMASLSDKQWQSDITNVDPNAIITTGVVWKNNIILGGLFNLDNIQYHIAYNDNGKWTGLLDTIQGNISTIYVLQNQLFIGGEFNGTTGTPKVTNFAVGGGELNNDASKVSSFAIYDLSKKAFQDVQGLLSSNQQAPGQVNVIRPQSDGKSIFVAGNFSFAGLLNCNSLCQLSSDSHQWSQMNQDIGGSIKDIAVQKNGALTVAGDLTVGSVATGLAVLDNVNTGSWKTVSNVPMSSILNDNNGPLIVSGKATNNQTYLGSWDGNNLNPIDTKLGASSNIQQLSYVPVSSSPSNARYPANSNKLLLAMGHLDVPGFGNCSAALFDGTSWYPYLLTSSVNGGGGSIRGSFSNTPCCDFKSSRGYLSVPAVILVSIAISLGIIFLLIALAFLFLIFKRKKNVNRYQTDPMKEWKPKYRPNSLLAMLDAAHLNDSGILTSGAVAATGGAGIAGASRHNDDNTTGYTTALNDRNQSMDISDGYSASRLRNSSGLSAGMSMMPFSAMMAHALKSDANDQVAASEETPKIYYAKFPFEAKEFGELAFDAHAPIVVTDTTDNVWWMGYKDDGSNNPVSGLFPSNYVSRVKPT